MLSLLNKPWVSGPLALGAVIYLLYRFIPADWDKRLGMGESVAVRAVEKVESTLIPNLRLFQAVPSKLHDEWKQPLRSNQLGRKLFDEIEPEMELKLWETYDMPQGTLLQGVVMEEGRHAAVISGRTYLEGEAYGNFRVAKIHRDWVLLTHAGGGREILRLGGVPGDFSRPNGDKAKGKGGTPRSP